MCVEQEYMYLDITLKSTIQGVEQINLTFNLISVIVGLETIYVKSI